MELNKTIILLSEVDVQYEDVYEEFRADLRNNKEFHKLSVQLFEGLERMLDLGCIVKDLDVGLVDFLSIFEGREIFFCWRVDEEKIEHWHEITGGFDERKSIHDAGLSID